MAKEKGKMELVTKMWAPLALEYAEFLSRYNLEPISIVVGKLYFGYEVAIFASEEEYLTLSQTNNKFNEEERQIVRILETIEALTCIARGINDNDAIYDEEDDDDEEYYYVDYDEEDDYY